MRFSGPDSFHPTGLDLPQRRVRFSLDNHTYDIMISPRAENELRILLTPYIAAGRRQRSHKPRRPTRASAKMVRAWAKHEHRGVRDRGPIPARVWIEYQAAINDRHQFLSRAPKPIRHRIK